MILAGAALFGVVCGWLVGLFLGPVPARRTGASTGLGTAAALATTFWLAGGVAAIWAAVGAGVGLGLQRGWRSTLRGRRRHTHQGVST